MVWIADRFGQFRPLMFALLVSVVAITLLLFHSGKTTYIVSMYLLGFAWSFGLSFSYALEARLDPGGSVVVVGGFFTAIGSVAGPALAATLVAPNGYNHVLLLAIAVYAVVMCLVTASVHFAARARTAAKAGQL